MFKSINVKSPARDLRNLKFPVHDVLLCQKLPPRSGDMGSKSLVNFDKWKIPKNPEGTDQKRGWINMIPINY